VLDFIHSVRKKGWGTIIASPPQRGDDANPTDYDATPAEPFYATILSRRVWPHVQVLLAGAILAPGKRTVSAVLRVMGLGRTEHFPSATIDSSTTPLGRARRRAVCCSACS
jgi:hypothetical protein